MRVLLLQEMSGVHTELKKGLVKLGVDVKIAAFGQHFRKYETDISLGTEKNDFLSSIERAIVQLSKIPEIRSFDVIQTISPQPFHKGIKNITEKLVYNTNKKLIYVAAGSDEIYRNHIRELAYWPPHTDYGSSTGYQDLKKRLQKFSYIIPVCWEYKYCMEKAGFLVQDTIPFPIDVQSKKYKPFEVDKKIRVFHPINRTNWKGNDFKGTGLIVESFEKLNKIYGNKIEFIAKGGMTAKEYDAFTDDVDIIIDQVNSYTYGMSAAYGLAKGKVVLSGLEEIAKIGHFSEAPIINLRPDANFISTTLQNLLESPKRIKELSELSRNFAEKYHDSEKVAQQYLKLYLK